MAKQGPSLWTGPKQLLVQNWSVSLSIDASACTIGRSEKEERPRQRDVAAILRDRNALSHRMLAPIIIAQYLQSGCRPRPG